ncbi:hypothetical protein JCM8547_006591 [Rhodosporidiobolus lusitaniae]
MAVLSIYEANSACKQAQQSPQLQPHLAALESAVSSLDSSPSFTSAPSGSRTSSLCLPSRAEAVEAGEQGIDLVLVTLKRTVGFEDDVGGFMGWVLKLTAAVYTALNAPQRGNRRTRSSLSASRSAAMQPTPFTSTSLALSLSASADTKPKPEPSPPPQPFAPGKRVASADKGRGKEVDVLDLVSSDDEEEEDKKRRARSTSSKLEDGTPCKKKARAEVLEEKPVVKLEGALGGGDAGMEEEQEYGGGWDGFAGGGGEKPAIEGEQADVEGEIAVEGDVGQEPTGFAGDKDEEDEAEEEQ